MTVRRALALFITTVVAGMSTSAIASAQAADTALLRLNAIGPLRLGMTRAAALRTGWLAHRRTGCPLGGKPLPVTYRLTGPHAPRGVGGVVEFDRGRLRNLSFTRGVHTSAGVTVGRTTVAQMVSRYRRAGFSASSQFVSTFGGTFVTVRRRGHYVIGGFASRRTVTTLAIPSVPVCE